MVLTFKCSRCDGEIHAHLQQHSKNSASWVIDPCDSCWEWDGEQARMGAHDAYLQGYQDSSSGRDENPPRI